MSLRLLLNMLVEEDVEYGEYFMRAMHQLQGTECIKAFIVL